jgi:anti-anti-sigma factor
VSVKAGTRQEGNVAIVDLSGQIKLGEGTSVLRDTVKDLLGKGQKEILLNMVDVNYIDSIGVGELVSAFTSARNQGGELKTSPLGPEDSRRAPNHEAVYGVPCSRRRRDRGYCRI